MVAQKGKINSIVCLTLHFLYAELSVRHLFACFDRYHATQVPTEMIRDYTGRKLEEGASPASVNRELSALRRMFNMGARSTPVRIDRVPQVPMLKEDKVRISLA